jgi:hypothetical protein
MEHQASFIPHLISHIGVLNVVCASGLELLPYFIQHPVSSIQPPESSPSIQLSLQAAAVTGHGKTTGEVNQSNENIGLHTKSHPSGIR